MLSQMFIGWVLFTNLLILLSLNIVYFILGFRDPSSKSKKVTYGLDATGFYLNLTAFSSTFMIAMWCLAVMEFLQNPGWFNSVIVELNPILRLIGVFAVSIGSVIFISSRIFRNRFAPAWGLTSEMDLIKSGPYRIIRHPSYFAYCIWFIFLPIATGIYLFVIYLPGIYGYVKVIEIEEKMLKLHFGEEYEIYSSKTKKLIPFIY